MTDIKEILLKNKTIAMIGVSKDSSKPSTIVMKYMLPLQMMEKLSIRNIS